MKTKGGEYSLHADDGESLIIVRTLRAADRDRQPPTRQILSKITRTLHSNGLSAFSNRTVTFQLHVLDALV